MFEKLKGYATIAFYIVALPVVLLYRGVKIFATMVIEDIKGILK